MKIPGLKKRFSTFDILLILFIWFIWSTLGRVYQTGIFQVKTITLNRSEHLFTFWGVFIFCIVAILLAVYLLLFEEVKPKGTKYDQDGNVNKDS